MVGSTPSLQTIAGTSIVADGDWDQVRLKLEDMELFQSLRMHLVEGKDLRDTPIYKGEAGPDDTVTSGSWHAIYEQNVEEHSRRAQELYASIREQGYLDQQALDSGLPHDEITIRIGRDGAILLENSIHRAMIAKIAGVRSVPAIVSARHSGWMERRQRFVDFAATRESGKLYGRLSHPDLRDIPHHHALDDRVGLFADHIRAEGGNALDLGCDTGLFSQYLDGRGFAVRAVERDPDLAAIARLLSQIEGHDVEFIVGDLADDATVASYADRPYKLVLCLNILHHLLKRKDTTHKLAAILGTFEIDQMILQCHRQDEPQMQTAYRNFSPAEFAQFIIDNSTLTRYEEIGVGSDGRTMISLLRD
ncbi:class I SAM-dependent methyltransferase [Aurantiacibacter zhengii]|uniref:Class I SAM-dependent methyltransferase n=1 Tax=Aurantiacibacter zhengii TaxID=2307003 RepID=A0A418NSI1_9SPHN|nr:class I SAM-dependent methyltransferase [Aurantiacibacter zhengii]RIV85885.1 class I SAM-dependent methyltransferase [Aurantiacibacter zhengii]